MKSILTVCVGNICRSPMASGLLKMHLPDFDVSSAGIGALIGSSADPTAVELMRSIDIDISRHVARQVNWKMCSESDLVLVMEEGHKKHLESIYPAIRGKIFMVCGGSKKNVPDPYKKNIRDFEYSLELIQEGVQYWVDRLNRLNREKRQ